MNTAAVNALQQLRDIHLPTPVATFPPAIGWILLWLVLFLAGAVALNGFYHRLPLILVKRQAKRLLKTIQTQPETEFIQALSVLHRRVVLALYPRDQVAGLTGPAWLDFLNRSAGITDFQEDVARVLISAPYEKQPRVDVVRLTQITKKWLRKVGKT